MVDWERIRALREVDLHFLKGSALNLGFTDLGTLCHAGEERAARGLLDGSKLAAIVDAYHASREVLRSRTSGQTRKLARISSRVMSR